MSNIHKQIFNTRMKYLVESKTDYILQNEKAVKSIAHRYLQDINRSIEKMTEDQIRQAAEYVLEKCEELPYTNKYMIWLMKQYIQGKFIIPEDLSKLNSELEQFSKINHKLEKKDINNYSWKEFLKVVSEMKDISTSNEEKRLAKAGSEKLFEDENWILIHPKTEEAACYYGKGTRWCTASTKGENYFDRYNQEGNLYIIINKKNPSEKYQFHFESGSFMNANDEIVNKIELLNISKDKELSNKLISLADEHQTIELPEEISNYNGGELNIDFKDLRPLYVEEIDSIPFDDLLLFLTSIPTQYFDTEFYETNYEFDSEHAKYILEVLLSHDLNMNGEKYRFIDEIQNAFLYNDSASNTLNKLMSKVKNTTDSDSKYMNFMISATYESSLKDIFEQLSEQFNMKVKQKNGTIITLNPSAVDAKEIEYDIYLYKIFRRYIVPAYTEKKRNDISNILAIFLDGNRISVEKRVSHWDSFDSKGYLEFIKNDFCKELDKIITKSDIKKIENEI